MNGDLRHGKSSSESRGVGRVLVSRRRESGSETNYALAASLFHSNRLNESTGQSSQAVQCTGANGTTASHGALDAERYPNNCRCGRSDPVAIGWGFCAQCPERSLHTSFSGAHGSHKRSRSPFQGAGLSSPAVPHERLACCGETEPQRASMSHSARVQWRARMSERRLRAGLDAAKSQRVQSGLGRGLDRD